MKKLIYSFLRKYIEKHYDVWGTKIEANLPPEFIVSQHAIEKMGKRFQCRPEKVHKIMLKAWRSKEQLNYATIQRLNYGHHNGIYKTFNGFVFVFRLRYNNRLGFSQKYLVTVFKRSGYQVYT